MNKQSNHLPGGLVLRIWYSHCHALGLIPSQGMFFDLARCPSGVGVQFYPPKGLRVQGWVCAQAPALAGELAQMVEHSLCM